MAKRQSRRHSPDFKRRVVEAARRTTQGQAARDFDVSSGLVWHWVRDPRWAKVSPATRKSGEHSPKSNGHSLGDDNALSKQIEELERGVLALENRVLAEAKDKLKAYIDEQNVIVTELESQAAAIRDAITPAWRKYHALIKLIDGK